jgi:NitT/TauT family transport system permease protein
MLSAQPVAATNAQSHRTTSKSTGFQLVIATYVSPGTRSATGSMMPCDVAGCAPVLRFLSPILVGLVILIAWQVAWSLDAFPIGTVPGPAEVAGAFGEEITSGRLFDDIIASLYRVAWGYVTAVCAAVPLGLVMGRSAGTKTALMPWINFFRNLSPIAWIPFAIVWFGVGDPPAIFIIFLATFFQIVLATTAAAASVPKVYYRVAEDMALTNTEVLFKITLPAILPQLVIALRVAIGVAWMVVVAAEMIAVRSGLGFLIVDARNGLRMDLVVCGMIVIGAIGIGLDLGFARLSKIPAVRWGFER